MNKILPTEDKVDDANKENLIRICDHEIEGRRFSKTDLVIMTSESSEMTPENDDGGNLKEMTCAKTENRNQYDEDGDTCKGLLERAATNSDGSDFVLSKVPRRFARPQRASEFCRNKDFLAIYSDSRALITRHEDLCCVEAIGEPDSASWNLTIESEALSLEKNKTGFFVL